MTSFGCVVMSFLRLVMSFLSAISTPESRLCCDDGREFIVDGSHEEVSIVEVVEEAGWVVQRLRTVMGWW